MGGSDGLEQMKTSSIVGYHRSVDYKAEMEEHIHKVYPDAKVTFRTVDDISQL